MKNATSVSIGFLILTRVAFADPAVPNDPRDEIAACVRVFDDGLRGDLEHRLEEASVETGRKTVSCFYHLTHNDQVRALYHRCYTVYLTAGWSAAVYGGPGGNVGTAAMGRCLAEFGRNLTR